MKRSLVFLLLLSFPALAQTLKQETDYGEANGGFPKWEERVVTQLTNRARVEPQADLAACPAGSCLESACYAATTPLYWQYDLNQAARFHSLTMGKFYFFAHDTPCTLFSDIDSRFPGTSDGSFASSCASSGSTSPGQRVALFGGSYGGENAAAGQYTPHEAFYGWLYETTDNPACGFNFRNGHRFNILSNPGPGLGVGHAYVDTSPYRNYWTQDFGGAVAASKIPSGSHWTTTYKSRDASPGDDTVEFWANWYDSGGKGPTTATVVLDNVPRTMTKARGTVSNGAYSATVAGVSSGCHTYYFSFVDSSANVVRYPTTGALGFGPGCADYSNGVTAPGAPAWVNANANTGTQVQVSWPAVAGATSYDVYRRASTGGWILRGSSLTTSYTDSTTSGSAYLYRVRAVNAGGASVDSPYDLVTTLMFADDPLGYATVRAIHLSDLRNAVTQVRALAGVSAPTFTDGATSGVVIRAVHITELRSQLDQAMAALSLPTGGWTDASLTNMPMKTVHFQQIRDRVK